MIYASTGEGSIIAFSNEDEVTPTDKKLRTTVKLKSGKEVRKHDERIYPPPARIPTLPNFSSNFHRRTNGTTTSHFKGSEPNKQRVQMKMSAELIRDAFTTSRLPTMVNS